MQPAPVTRLYNDNVVSICVTGPRTVPLGMTRTPCCVPQVTDQVVIPIIHDMMNFVHLFRQFRQLSLCWVCSPPAPNKSCSVCSDNGNCCASHQIKVVTKQPCYWATFTAIMPFMFVMFCLFREVWCGVSSFLYEPTIGNLLQWIDVWKTNYFLQPLHNKSTSSPRILPASIQLHIYWPVTRTRHHHKCYKWLQRSFHK